MPHPSPAVTRYYPLPISFFTDTATAGLSPLAACLYLRARAASLIGVLQLSPRVLARAHGRPAAEADDAISELVGRELAVWSDEHEILLVLHSLDNAQGSARSAAAKQIAALPPTLREVATARLGSSVPAAKPAQLDLGSAPLRDPGPAGVGPHDSDSDSRTDSRTGSRSAVVEAADPVELQAERVLVEIDRRRESLGLRKLPPSQRSTRWIRQRLDEGIPVGDLLLAVELRAAECKAEPKALRYFDASSPFTGPGSNGPGGWSVSARMIDQHHRSRPRTRPGPAPSGPPPTDQAAADFERRAAAERLAEAKRREAAAKGKPDPVDADAEPGSTDDDDDGEPIA
jgi:hypothetical protein